MRETTGMGQTQSFFKHDMGMKTTSLDISFFYKRNKDELEGVSGSYVDDGLNAGNDKFISQEMIWKHAKLNIEQICTQFGRQSRGR